MSAIVNYINQAFCSSSSASSVFALYPPSLSLTPEVDQQLNYVHSLMKVLAVKALCYALSMNMTQPALLHSCHLHALDAQHAATYAQSPSLGAASLSPNAQQSTSPQSLSLILLSILREFPLPVLSPLSLSESARSSNTLMSNLLSIAQNVIPLTQGVGRLEELEQKQIALQAGLYQRHQLKPVSLEMKQLSIHVDLCHRAQYLHPASSQASVAWVKRKHIEIKLLEEEKRKQTENHSEVIRGLQDMGYDLSLCHRALLLCNGDSSQAVNYLVEHGLELQTALRQGLISECWGLEGVDFYQEKGHWEPETYREVDGGGIVDAGSLPIGAASSPSSVPLITDPYRRLALSTAKQMKVQSELNERFATEKRGMEGRTTVTCSLDEEDLRVGQLLRVSTAWCISQQAAAAQELRQSSSSSGADHYRWYFLTEDNHWAPLDARDCHKLEQALTNHSSIAWIGVEDKTPSLVRLDKMCMYNEITGHSRPLKRRKTEHQHAQAAHQQHQRDSSLTDGSGTSEPPPVKSVYSTLSSELQLKATDLSVLGFPISHCARALIETRGNVESAANWIISNEAALIQRDAEEDRKIKARQQWEKKQQDNKKESDAVAANQGKEARDHPSLAASSSSASSQQLQYEVDLPLVFAHSGALGTVKSISPSGSHVILSICDLDSCLPQDVCVPLAACEYDDTKIVHLLPELNSRKFQGLSGLALDVASSEFILYARRCVLLLLYMLSNEKGGKIELIKNLNANVFIRIIKLASADQGPLTLPTHIPSWLQKSLSKNKHNSGPSDMTNTASSLASQPPSSQSSPLAHAASPVSRSLWFGGSGGVSSGSAAVPVSPDLWLVLATILANPSPIFASSVRDQLLHQLVDDVRLHLMSASSTVRDVDTEHPYQSSFNEKNEIRIEAASHLLVTFDRRCNINQAHACLVLYKDEELTEELAVFSGSADEFSHIVVPGNHFYYQFTSGSLRQKPYEFGFRFRVRPLGYRYKDETSLLTYSLGWPVMAILCDSHQLIDAILGFQVSMDLINSMLRYLTVCRSPCKVMVTRALTAICVRIKQPMPLQMFEILLRVMEQLYESNTASGWGSSPFLMSLVDLIRVRPTFKLSDSELWSVESIDNRPSGWFFLTVLRAESLSKSIFFSSKLPNPKVVERAYHEMSDMEVLRWCLKQPELCLKLHKQTRGWNSYRRDWMTGINGFTQFSQAADVLIALKQSLLPECYRFPLWVQGTAGKDWEDRVKKSLNVSDIARCYLEFEAALKWGDSYPEAERAFGDTWASRRPDWLAAMKGLAAATTVRICTQQEAMDYRWSRALDEQLVLYIDDLANKTARRLMSLTFRDIQPLSVADQEKPQYSLLRAVPVEYVRGRFAILKMISTDYMRVLPVVDLTLRCSWSLSPLIRQVSKSLIFQQSKMYLWRSMLGRLYSEERPQFVILNRHEAAKKRKDATSRLHHSLFYQLYQHVGLLVDPSALRRRGQAWMVKFVGEGGHDVGGLYNESLVDICNELQSEGNPNSPHAQLLPLFRLCPNGRHAVGENRNKYIPTSSSTSPLTQSMYQFIGRLMGICCLDNNRALPLDLCSMVWKVITNEPITFTDLKHIDYHTYNTINIIRNPHSHQLNEETFDYLFPDLFFTTESSEGVEMPLCEHGRSISVHYHNSQLYAQLLERFKLNEFHLQIAAIARGLSSIIPYDFLSIFTSEQLEVMITGSPEIDVALLREKTEYRGSVSGRDRHIHLFWEVLTDFTAEEKKQFVQFVSGRSRLPSTALGFGKDMFKLSDHAQAMSANAHHAPHAPPHTSPADSYLPVAHTCFFALELPRYSSKSMMRNKLLYAIQNCVSIDGDATHEGRANMMMTWSDSD